MDLDPLTVDDVALSRERCGRSLLRFAREAHKILRPASTWVDGWHLAAICEHLEALARREIKGLILNVPPRHIKSTLCSVAFPAWLWTHNPGETILTASYASGLSIRDSARSRRVIESGWYRERWGDRVSIVDDQNQKQRYETTAGGFRFATSVGGTVTGEGGSVRILDDPHKADEVLSEATRVADLDWVREVWASREDANPVELIVMQRLHGGDIAGHYLETKPDYVHLRLPAYADKDHKCRTAWPGHDWTDPREDGEELWPERPGSTLQELQDVVGPYAWAGQYEQRPSPLGGNLVKTDWWQFYDATPEKFRCLIQSWDATFKKTERGSYVVGQLWGCNWPLRYLIDERRGRWDFEQTVQEIRAATADWIAQGYRASPILVEDKANGPAIVNTLKRELDGVQEWRVATGDKAARMIAETPAIARGQVLLPQPALRPWVRAYIEELARFPHEPNDRGDATSQALQYLRSRFIDGSAVVFTGRKPA